MLMGCKLLIAPSTPKQAISGQMYRARRPRSLHPNPFVATHRPDDSPGPIHLVYVDNRALSGRPQGRTGDDPTLQEKVDGHVSKEGAHRAPRLGSP